MNTAYVEWVLEVFESHRNPSNVEAMARYMKGKFEYLGIKSPLRKHIAKTLLDRNIIPPISEVTAVVDELWATPWREIQYFAMDLLIKYSENAPESWIEFYEKLITHKSWWDTVDGLAAWHVGDYFRKYPGRIPVVTYRWMKSDNMWLQRTCLIFQLRYGKNTDFQLLTTFIEPLSYSKEFFIQKAIGWALRQYYRVAPEEVYKFVKSHQLHSLSEREALKHHKSITIQ